MGILKALGAMRKATTDGSRPSKAEMPKCRVASSTGTITLVGDVSSTVYVYVPERLRGISRGDKFTLECSKKPMRLTSTVTGTEWDSADAGDIPLLYKGRPVGFLSGYRVCRAVQKVLDTGLTVKVTAVCKAEGKKRGWPTICALTPAEDEIEDLANKRLAELGMQPLPKSRTRSR